MARLKSDPSKLPLRVGTILRVEPGAPNEAARGLLQRLDYVAVGPAAHYCFDHATFGGLVFPTLRRVVSRSPSGPRVNAPTSVLLQITDVVVND
jgi:hypothetical protein